MLRLAPHRKDIHRIHFLPSPQCHRQYFLLESLFVAEHLGGVGGL